MLRAAFSSVSLGNVLGEAVNKTVHTGYAEAADTTAAFVTVREVPNFKTIDAVRLADASDLRLLPPGTEAEHASIDDDSEQYRAYRFARKLSIDEQHIINDDASVLLDLPMKMGAASGRVRPDLVYYILLAAAALSDSVALFHADHANLDSNALSATNLEAGIIKMGKQTDQNGAVLNLSPAAIMVPIDLKFTAETILSSVDRRGTAGASPDGTRNPLQSADIRPVADARLGAAGVRDPITGTLATGSATNWFLAANPMQAAGIEVAYRTGTNRRPRVRRSIQTDGRFGVTYDITLDIGAKALDHRPLYQGNA
jgi:hypothetical protein